MEPHRQYCTCSQKQIHAYRNRLSGPIYDRMDLLLFLRSVVLEETNKEQETSQVIRERIEKARDRQYERYQEEITNAKVPFELLSKTSRLTNQQQHMLTKIAANQNWSNRVQIKVIRLARTISDLIGETKISDASVWEAMSFRRMGGQKQQVIAREK